MKLARSGHHVKMVENEADTLSLRKTLSKLRENVVFAFYSTARTKFTVYGAEFSVLFDLKENNKLRNKSNKGNCLSLEKESPSPIVIDKEKQGC